MGYVHAGRPVGLPESAVTYTGKLFSGFLRCVEVSHNLDHLHMLYRGVRVDCKQPLTLPESRLKSVFWISPPMRIVHPLSFFFLSSSVSLALYAITNMIHIHWVSALIPSFLA